MVNDQSRYAALSSALRGIQPQPIDTHNPLAILRPLFDGTMTIGQALSPEVQAAIEACEQIAYGRDQRGRHLCDRVNGLRPIPALRDIAGW